MPAGAMARRIVLAATLRLTTSALLPAAARPVALMDCSRPSLDDVERISYGRPAKRRGTGSRGVPHRLNEDERKLYDLARRKGFVAMGGSGWRAERAGAPLVNTFRLWCDARAVPAIYMHKRAGETDEVVVDLTPLRSGFDEAAAFCLALAPGGALELPPPAPVAADDDGATTGATDAADASVPGEATLLAELRAAYDFGEAAIHQLPMLVVAWSRPRAEAKVLAGTLAAELGTADAAATPTSMGPRTRAGSKGPRKAKRQRPRERARGRVRDDGSAQADDGFSSYDDF